ncbi:MAG: PEGA domain-containing protein [bacterium]|jgi:hypothetical protein
MARFAHILAHRLAHNLVSGIVLGVAVAALSGCVERRIWIDTAPRGALVWVNDAQVGRTPVDLAITHEGTYDLRIEKEGFEPLITPATTEGPIWDMVPLDLVVEILPIKARNESRWKFTLVPRDDSENALVDRATALRDRLRGEAAAGGEGQKAGEAELGQLEERVEDKPADPAVDQPAQPRP